MTPVARSNPAFSLALGRCESCIRCVKLTKERRIYVVILGLGVAGVAADRLWLSAGGPAAASAAMSDQPVAAAASTGEAAKPSSLISVAGRFEQLRQSQQSENSDAFVLPVAWRTSSVVAADGEQVNQQADDARPAKDQPRVTSIIGRGSSVAAVIDGHTVRLGEESKSGVRLVSVKGMVVTVARGEQTYVIDLSPKPQME